MNGLDKLKLWNRINGRAQIPIEAHPIFADNSVASDIKAKRLATCRSCSKCQGERCDHCSCPIEVITGITTYKCPEGKWGNE